MALNASAVHSVHSALDVENLRDRVDAALAAFMDSRAARLEEIAEPLRPVAHALTAFLLDGGKRLRPAFCYWGWRGAGGAPDGPAGEQIVAAATALELLQACALIHDDLMDDSDTRRGLPAVHRRFAALHAEHDWHGSAERFGSAAAILLGDLCLSWCDEMFSGRTADTSTDPSAAEPRRARRVFDLMRTEVMAGQYLDVLEQAIGGGSVDRARRVIRYKSAKYTVERPLHLGAALAGADEATLRAYSTYGLPLGEAFQLRDDVLGVFGDPATTGKPAGDDLREGKRTVLVALALQRVEKAQARTFGALLGRATLDPEGVARLQKVITDTGALAEVETMIARLVDEALTALEAAPVAGPARRVLSDLATAATHRRA